MKKIFYAIHDIKKRLQNNNNSIRFVSDRFLQELLIVLDTAENIYKFAEALERLLSQYDLDKIRYQLARVPMAFSVVKDMQGGTGSIRENIGLKRDDIRYTLNPSDYRYRSENVPDYVPDLETSHHSDTVWCLCSETQAKRYQVDIDIPCWHETDSLVDWMRECIQREVQDANSEVAEKTQEPSVVSEPVEETELTSKERIYQYHVKNSPVTTSDLLAQKFVGRSQTLNLRSELEAEGKIKKLKHGGYTAI